MRYIGYTSDIFKPGFPIREFDHVGALWYEIIFACDADKIKQAGFWIAPEGAEEHKK